MWVISTSALLFGVPWALAFSEEAQIMEVDRERSMQADVNEVFYISPSSLCQRKRSVVLCCVVLC